MGEPQKERARVEDAQRAEAAAMVVSLRRAGSVFAEEELVELSAAAADRAALAAMVERRIDGEPIEQIVGAAVFGELRVAVHTGVFVPRRRTVLLATIVAERLASTLAAAGSARLLDLGCGTGAIAALAIHRVPGIEVVAFDADPNAVACARENLPSARVLLADSLEAMDAADRPDASARDASAPNPSARFDVIAANLPYVPSAELAHLPHDARDHEPLLALDGGVDGLAPLRAHVAAIALHLLPGGAVVTEVAPHQIEAATAILHAAGLGNVELHSDDEIGATALLASP